MKSQKNSESSKSGRKTKMEYENRTHISRQAFDAVFSEIMKQDTIYFGDGTTGKESPKCCMRNQETGFEIEFTDNEKAFKYFSENSEVLRVMDVGGGIYFDTY